MKRILGLMLVLALFVTPCFSEWDKDVPASTDQWTAFPAQALANNTALDLVLSNYNTIKLSYSSATTIVASAGEVVCSNAAGSVRYMSANTSTTNITFANIDTGSEASSTTYYVYAICASGAATFKISTSASAPTGETYYKRLGSFYNDGSSNIDQFLINNDKVEDFAQEILDYGSSTSSYTIKDATTFKVAFGKTNAITGETTTTITNLPFASSSSYTAVVTWDNAVTGGPYDPPQVTRNSGSSLGIENENASGNNFAAHWFAFGY